MDKMLKSFQLVGIKTLNILKNRIAEIEITVKSIIHRLEDWKAIQWIIIENAAELHFLVDINEHTFLRGEKASNPHNTSTSASYKSRKVSATRYHTLALPYRNSQLLAHKTVPASTPLIKGINLLIDPISERHRSFHVLESGRRPS